MEKVFIPGAIVENMKVSGNLIKCTEEGHSHGKTVEST